MPDFTEDLAPYDFEIAFDPAELKRQSIHGGIATLVAQAITSAARFASVVILARLLSPGDFGLVAMVTPIIGFVGTINDLGFAQAIIQRRNITERQISSLFWINLAISFGLAALLVSAAPLVGWIYKEPRTVALLVAMASLLIIGTAAMVPRALLRRSMQFMPLAIADVGNMAGGAAITVVAALIGFGYWSLLIGQIAGATIGAILAYAFTRWRPSRPKKDPALKQIVRFGANLTGANLATYFSMTADNMIVGIFAGKVPLGFYDRSYTLTIQPLNQSLSPIGQVSIPLLSRLQGSPDLYRRSYLTMLRLAMLLTMPAMLFCIFLARPLIVVLLGDQWRPAAPLFAWICFGGLAVPVFSSTGWVFTTQNRTGKQMIVSVVTALIAIASFAIGIVWGVTGVAAVSAISFTFIQCPISIRAMTRTGPVQMDDMVKTLAPYIISALCVAVPLHYLRGTSNLVGLAGMGVLTYTLFGLCILLLPGGRDFFATVLSLFSTLRQSLSNPSMLFDGLPFRERA
jgi:PST family polysaccharide transporter